MASNYGYFEGGHTGDYQPNQPNPELDGYLRRLTSKGKDKPKDKAAKPGDKKGGRLDGKREQLQKLPNGKMQGHGGEYVVNAEATDAYGPLLEMLNRSVPAKAKGKKPEKPKKGKGYFGGGESGETGESADAGATSGGAPGGDGETGPGPGESGPGASTGGTSPGVGAGPGIGDAESATGPTGPAASTAGGVTAGTSGSGGVADDPFAPGPGVSPAFGVPAGEVSMTPAAAAAGLTPADFGFSPSAVANDEDIGITAFGLANDVSSPAPPGWSGQPVGSFLTGFLPGAVPFGMAGRNPNTMAQRVAANVLGTLTGVPGASNILGGLMGAANTAIANQASQNVAGTGFNVSPGALAVAAGQIAGTPGVTTANTGPSSGPAVGGMEGLPPELAALEHVIPEAQRRTDRTIAGRSIFDEALTGLQGRGLDISRSNPWALAQAAMPMAGQGVTLEQLVNQARKFFSA